MLTFVKPTAEELSQVIGYATQENGADRWVESFLANLTTTLRKNPKQYRAFGVYWWLIKKELLAFGIDAFGDETDAEWVEKTSYGVSVVNLVSAFLYYEKRIQLGLIFEPEHLIEFLDDVGDTVSQTYVLYDPEMELLAAGQR